MSPHKIEPDNERTNHEAIDFESLPLRSGDPPYSAWGRWGDEDEIGTLNFLTPETVKSALLEVKDGIRIPLNLPLDFLARPMNPAREECKHEINAKGPANDDSLNMDTQGSSHFDGLRHVPYQKTHQYYNGVTQDDISGQHANGKIGVQNAAKQGIAARGVLLDWRRYAEKRGIQLFAFRQP